MKNQKYDGMWQANHFVNMPYDPLPRHPDIIHMETLVYFTNDCAITIKIRRQLRFAVVVSMFEWPSMDSSQNENRRIWIMIGIFLFSSLQYKKPFIPKNVENKPWQKSRLPHC